MKVLWVVNLFEILIGYQMNLVTSWVVLWLPHGLSTGYTAVSHGVTGFTSPSKQNKNPLW